jgi:multicomponent Na+:H+ antiporter subunit F
MIGLALDMAFGLIGLAALAVVIRIVRGPTIADRILGLDTLTLIAIAAIGIFAAKTGLYLYVDIAVAVALVGLLATLAFARYLLSRGRS